MYFVIFIISAPPVLFTLDADETYAVHDSLNEFHNKAFGGKLGVDPDLKYGDENDKDEAKLRGRNSEDADGTAQNVIVRSVAVTVPSFTFECNKSISAVDYMEVQQEDGNIEAIYGILSMKIFGIGVSIPMDDASLCQFVSMFLGRHIPLYTNFGHSSSQCTEAMTLAERGLRRGT